MTTPKLPPPPRIAQNKSAFSSSAELVARVPYQAWENVAYVAVTHTAREPGFARRVFDRVRVSRWEQDNEQWHLLILEEMTRQAPRGSWLKSRVLPQILAFGHYQLSWLMYAIRPAWSYRHNADFEDHAEHEYAELVEEHPEWEDVSFTSSFGADFGEYASLADLFRQIGYDERLHKLESEANMAAPASDEFARWCRVVRVGARGRIRPYPQTFTRR